MMNEEQYIKSRMSGKNPFKVPEGYFDSLATKVMQQLPEQPKRGLVVILRPWLYAAACVAAILLTATVYFFTPDHAQQMATNNTIVATTDSYVDEVVDYVMADNNTIYACLNDY